jgi:crossover junction endodeoxyribonuclease RuvC
LFTGYGLIARQGSALAAVEAGRLAPPKDLALPARLAWLAAALDQLLDRLSPDRAVLEAPFLGLNTRSLIVLAEARGVLLAGLARRAVEVAEYSPAEVKSAVTGNGRADKQQVARMVRILLAAGEAAWPADATDALAAALCGAQRQRLDSVLRASREGRKR